MISVNKKQFELFDLDSINTFKDRIAANLNTLPEYLYFQQDFVLGQKEIIVEDILDAIKLDAKKNIPISLDDIKNKIRVPPKELLSIWFAYNEGLKVAFKHGGDVSLQTIAHDLIKRKVYFTESQFIREYKDSIKNKRKYLTKSIDLIKSRVERTITLFSEYTIIKEPAISTDFRIEYIQFVLKLKCSTSPSILELFNSVVLTKFVPFVSTEKFFKITQDFIPPTEWATKSTERNSMIIKVSQNHNVNYSDAVITIDPDVGDITVNITINTDNNISKEVFIERTLDIFNNFDIKIKDSKEIKVVGLFYYPGLTLDKYIFADLVMNDNIFKIVLNLDDHEKATKRKSGVYIYFNHQNTGFITATITEKKSIKNDISMKNEVSDYFPIGESYIRVRISQATNMEAVEKFKEMLGKLFILYDHKYNEIIKFYREYIPEFGNIKEYEKEDHEQIKLSDKVPELFVTNYSRNCSLNRMPVIISEQEALELKDTDQHIIKFPRDIPANKDTQSFPMDGINQHYYTCKHKDNKFVGLKNNKLKNASIYPYIPCCFKSDQTKKQTFKHYYEGVGISTSNDKQTMIIKTDKILKHNQYGTLPPKIENLLTLIDPNPRYEYVRRGTGIEGSTRNVNSFLNVVMEAFDSETNILSIQDKDVLETYLIEQRHLLATKKTASLCRQELYDLNTEQIIDLLKSDAYLDPRLFLHIFEDKFQCNIFIFSNTSDGEMNVPRHTQAYYKNYNTNKSIYIYEHMGSFSDTNIKYPWPQCELIVKYNIKSSEVQSSFSHTEAKNIRNIFSRLVKAYSLNNIIKENLIQLTKKIKLISQVIDSFGKTRQLNIRFDNNIISILTTPIQPLKIKETIDTKIHRTTIDIAMKLIKELDIQSGPSINNTIKGLLGNVQISIYLVSEIEEDKESLLQIYNRHKKLARYLVEYTLYTYSNYINTNSLQDVIEEDDTVAKFAKEYFIVDETYIYKPIEKTFKKDNSLMIKGKIIVHNEETIKRLVYCLRINIKRDKNKILKFFTLSGIENFYVDITDFDQYDNQVILSGEDSVENWILENNIKYTLYNEIQISTSSPYFFKNDIIDNNIYLAQNTTSLQKATDIATNWIIYKYNNKYNKLNTSNIQPLEFTLYTYVNSTTIKKYNIKGKKEFKNIKIIIYKIDDTTFYTTLLKIK